MNTALARGAVPYKARSVAWYDPLTGGILDERDEQVVKVQPHASVVEVLRTVRARMLYLLPDEIGRYPERSWFTGCVEIGCKIDKYLSKTHSATISRGEKIIDIHPVGQYFDTAPSTSLRCEMLKRLGKPLEAQQFSLFLLSFSVVGLFLL
jgi:hypothetical protein